MANGYLQMYNMSLTLEKYFESMVSYYPDVKELHGLMDAIKKE